MLTEQEAAEENATRQAFVEAYDAQTDPSRLPGGKSMLTFKGLFELRTSQDLLSKLRYDRERLRSDPLNQYTAFDFVATGYHMMDWVYPGGSKPAEKERRDERNSNKWLKMCGHLANSAKHFDATREPIAVKEPFKQEGAFQPDTVDQNAFQVEKLRIRLDGDTAKELKKEFVDLSELADEVLKFWENHKALKSNAASAS